jgi:hypothetical protein
MSAKNCWVSSLEKERVEMKKKTTRKRKPALPKMVTVAIRFSDNLKPFYTYKVKRTAKLYLGQEVVVRNCFGTKAAYVVHLAPPMPPGYSMETLSELTDKVAPL